MVVVVWSVGSCCYNGLRPEQHPLTAKAEVGFAMQVCKFGPSRGASVHIAEARLFQWSQSFLEVLCNEAVLSVRGCFVLLWYVPQGGNFLMAS